MPLELTPLRVEQDRGDFENQILLDCFPDLLRRRSSAAGRSARGTSHGKDKGGDLSPKVFTLAREAWQQLNRNSELNLKLSVNGR